MNVYSSDSHVIEPADLWTTRIEPRWRHLAPRVVSLDDTDVWIADEDRRIAVVGIQDQAGLRFDDPSKITKKARMDELPRGAAGWTPSLYLRGLDEDGVAGALLYPSTAVQAWRVIGGELLAAVARTYNDWIFEFCSEAPDRLKPAPMIPVEDPAAAVAEMTKAARRGARAVMLPVLPTLPKAWDLPEFEPIWAAAADLGLSISFHLGSNQNGRLREPALDLVVHATKDMHVQRAIGTMILSGIFARHPTLRVGAVEFGGAWAAHVMQRLDAVYRAYGEVTLPAGELPSDHFRRNVFLSFQDDVAAVGMRDVIGVRNLLWGNDFPHAESTYPRSREFLARHLADVPPDEAALIAGGNAAGLYGFA